jgi:hypothetical protein
MPILDIYAGDTFIGEAVLDEIDDGMGVAFGPFHPASGYDQVRPQVTAAAEARDQNLEAPSVDLRARSKAGELIESGFVVIDDFADIDVDPEATVQFANRDQWLRLLRSAV